MSRTLRHESPANIETTAIGNNNLIPKTAIKIPQVKKRCCHFGDIFSNFVALITALSKDKLTSKIDKMNAINTQWKPLPCKTCSPQNHANAKPIIDIISESKICFIVYP